MSRGRGLSLLVFAAMTVIAFLFPQAVPAHMMITGSALDVVVYRDRIAVRADIIPYEIDAIQSNLGDSCNDPDKELAAYCQRLVLHLHIWADGKPLSGKLLRFARPANLHDPRSRAVCELEFRSSSPAIWPDGAKDGSVEIHHSLLSGPTGENLSAYIVDLSYSVRIRQEDQAAQEGLLLTQGQGVTFACDWKNAASGPAPQTQPGQPAPTLQTPWTGFHLPNEEDVRAKLMTERLTLPIFAAAFLMAFIWGGAHAMTPGHGKAVVAAYLVGSRGTPRHAVFLGLTVTLTHTAVVFALGLVALLISQSKAWWLMPWMETASCLIVAGIGAAMLISRVRALSAHSGSVHLHDHSHGLDHGHEHDRGHDDHPHDHSHGHDHEHEHGHDHDHAHEHDDHPHDHEHGDHPHGHGHSHLPPGADGKPITWRSLLGLGVSGGLLPCPGALVLLLLAVGMDRTALGITLLVAFSLGLAAVLTTIGLLFVTGGKLVGRIPHGVRTLRFLPIASALFILAVGVWLTVEAAQRIKL